MPMQVLSVWWQLCLTAVSGAQTLLRNSMSQEQRTALVQAHRRARRQLAALQASRVSCRTVATELLSDDPSFRGCLPLLLLA